MLPPMTGAGGLPANLELRMADEGRLVARHVPFPLAHGGVIAVPPYDVYYRKRGSILALSQVPFSFCEWRNPATTSIGSTDGNRVIHSK